VRPLAVRYEKEFPLSERSGAPLLEVNSWAKCAFERYRDFGLAGTLHNVFDEKTYVRSTFHYHDDPREDYFGQGPNLSIGDGAAFSLEEYSVSLAAGRHVTECTTVELGGIISTADVEDGKDNKKKPIHAFSGLDGLEGAKLGAVGLSLEHDTRDSLYNPKRGGFQRLKAGWYEGIDGDDYGYRKYSFDVAEYIPVGDYIPFVYWDSVLAVRIGGEINDDVHNDKIPFYDLSRLGGGETVRGYQYNRFFDENSLFYSVEYRYNIWQMKDYKLDATVFFDCGWIFDEISEFELDKYKEGYGIGLRLVLRASTVVLEGAHSDEGTEVYLKVTPIF